jgi:hypothetical protein
MRRREVARFGARGAAARREAKQRTNLIERDSEVAGATNEAQR